VSQKATAPAVDKAVDRVDRVDKKVASGVDCSAGLAAA
jgi:hypothetical protein